MIDKKDGIENRLNPRMFDAEPMQRCTLNECKGACCIFGVWVDSREVKDILSNADLIIPFMPPETSNPEHWFAPIEDDDKHSPSGKVVHTAVETRPDHPGGTACIFWQSDGKCILQIAGVQNKLHPWRFKPYYCIMHPIDLDDEGRFTLDSNDELLTEPGSCLRPADHPIPLLETFKAEFLYLLGSKNYSDLIEGQKKYSQKTDLP
jgi:hypothetical protein